MSRLAFRSVKVEQLLPTDLPHMEDYIRQSGAEEDLRTDKAKEGGINLSTGPEQITKWMLVKSLWRGRGMTVFISELSFHTGARARGLADDAKPSVSRR